MDGAGCAGRKTFPAGMIQSAVAFIICKLAVGRARRMYLMQGKFARLDQPVFMSLDLAEYQGQLDSRPFLASISSRSAEIEPPGDKAPQPSVW